MPPALFSSLSISFPSDIFKSVEQARYATIITPVAWFRPADSVLLRTSLLFGNPGIWLATPLAELLTTLFILTIYIKAKKSTKNIVSLQHGNDDKEILPKIQTP